MFILVVDNNRFFVSVLQTMLHNAGFNCIESVGNGIECLILANRKDSPDVIIIDESLCFVDGLEILNNIRLSLPATRIIILTAADSSIDITHVPDDGSVFFMEKHRITSENLPQVLYNIFTEKISATRLPKANNVFSTLRRSLTGMLNFVTF
jgi:CheY-like chemotaxis protein